MTIRELTLAELGHLSRGRSRHRPRDAEFLYGGPYPFIQTGDVKKANFFVTGFSQTYSDAGLAQSKMWPAGTLCITIAANIAEVAILGIDACFPDSVIGFIADETICDRRYVKYWFDVYKRRFKQVAQGAAQDNLSQQKLLSFKLPVPELPTQTRIADILFAYDDLIENNRRRIELLEEAVRQLYEEWFVRLRFPGHEVTKIVDGVPKGWSRCSLGDVATEIADRVHPTNVSPDTPYVGLEHIPRRSLALTEYGAAAEVDSSKFRFAKDDILFGKIRPYFHKVVPAPIVGICSSDTIVIRPNTEILWSLVVAAVTRSEFVAYANQTARVGARMPRASWKKMKEYPILIPSPDVVDKTNRLIRPAVELIQTLCHQNQKLAAARDLLLPRLMGSEIEV